MKRSLRDEIQQTRPFASDAQEVFLNLVRTTDLLERETAKLLKEHGLSLPQYNVLRILRGVGEEGHPIHEIGARMVAQVPDVTRLVDRLVDRNLVERRRSETDKRVVIVSLLAEGQALVGRLDEPVLELQERQFAGLSGEDRHALSELLVKLRDRG